MSAETEYLFRHALLQEAAYALQLPSERAVLHGIALESIEAAAGPGHLEALALDMANHACLAAAANPAFTLREITLLKTGEVWAAREHRLIERLGALSRIATHPMSQPGDRVRADCDRGLVLRLLGRTTEAEALLKPLCQTQDRALRAQALNQLAAVCLRTGRAAEALDLFREAHDAALATGNHRMAARALTNVALTQFELHLMEACAATLDRASLEAEQAGDTGLMAQVRGHRGRLYHHQNLSQQAADEYRASIELAQRQGDRATLANSTANLAELLRRSGRPGAKEALQDALRQAAAIGDRYLEMITLGNYALLLKEKGDLAQSRTVMERNLAMAQELGDRLHGGFTLSNLANLLFALGDRQGCTKASAEAMAIALELRSLRLEATVCLARGSREPNTLDLQRAADLAAQVGDGHIQQEAEDSLRQLSKV